MNCREKFNAVMSFDTKAPILKTEFGYWAATVKKWFIQGLPKIEDIPKGVLDGDLVRGSSPLLSYGGELVDKNVRPYFKLDYYLAKFPFDISPMLEEKVLEEDKDYKIFTDRYGITQKVTKKCASIPMVIDYPIKNMRDFYSYISLYDDGDYKKRLPKNWESLVKKLKNRDYPIRLGGSPYGFSFLPRHLMGEVTYMLSMYDDPKLIKEINKFFLDFITGHWSKILDRVDIDCIIILEDIAYRSGSFISEEAFRKFMVPYYIKFVDFLKQYGIKNIVVDSDGLVDELIPLWMEVGVSGIFPIEAVNNLVKIREDYPKLQLLGGINKRVLFKDSNKGNIDQELKRISKVLSKGGYIPHIDHAVSEDATWENFKYYREKLNNIINNL